MKPTTLVLLFVLMGVGVGGFLLLRNRKSAPPTTPANNGTPNQSPGGCQKDIGQLTALGALVPDPRAQGVALLGQNKFAQSAVCGGLSFLSDPVKTTGQIVGSGTKFLDSKASWSVPPVKLAYESGKVAVKGAKAVGKAIGKVFGF